MTIPEGPSRREVAADRRRCRHSRRLPGGERAAQRRSARAATARRTAPPLEGFLFPATYELAPSAAGERARRRAAGRVPGCASRASASARAKHKNLTAYDVLTIASMIEREAAIARDRPLIAAVIYNRLHARMALGIDATLRYALDDWTQPLTASQLASDCPFNTRAHRACRRRRSVTPGWLRFGRRRIRPTSRTCTTSSSRAATAHTRSARPTRSSSATSMPTTAPVPRPAGRARRRVSERPLRRPRLARRAQSIAGDVHGDRRRLPAPAGATGAVRGDGVAAWSGGLRGRERDDPAQAGGVGARRRGAPRARASAPPTRSRSPTGGSRPTTPTLPASWRRSPSPSSARRRWYWVPAAVRAPWSGR